MLPSLPSLPVLPALLALSLGVLCPSALAAPLAAAGAGTAGTGAGTGAQAACRSPEIYAAYWRTWNDAATGFAGTAARMGSLPGGTDVVLVFEAGGALDPTSGSGFGAALRDEYVPALHARGALVARSLGAQALRDVPVPADGDYDAAARDLIARFVTPWGLDGLDFDLEDALAPADVAHFAALIGAVGAHLGPRGRAGTLLVLDTNRDADDDDGDENGGMAALLPRIADSLSYVFLQAYGRAPGPERLQASWASYAPHIDSCRFVPGFSFYEERGDNHWRDTEGGFNASRAGQYAAWQPDGGRKGGVFAYAADRDWKAENDDSISPPTYEFAHEIFKLQGKE